MSWFDYVQGMMLIMLPTVSFYMITAYTPTFGRETLRLDGRGTLLVTLAVGLSNFIWLPVMGAISDRRGRRPQLLICSTALAITAYPTLVWLTAAPTVVRLLLVELWFSFLFAGYQGSMVVTLTELIPAEVRTTGFSLAYRFARCEIELCVYVRVDMCPCGKV